VIVAESGRRPAEKQEFSGSHFAVVSLESVGISSEKGASGATLRWALLRSRMVVPWL
jgi:hypothetical protein